MAWRGGGVLGEKKGRGGGVLGERKRGMTDAGRERREREEAKKRVSIWLFK